MPVFVIEVPAPPPRPPESVAVIWGASTLKVAAALSASTALPRSVRLLVPSKARLPAIVSGLSIVWAAVVISRAPVPRASVPVPTGPLVITGRFEFWVLPAPKKSPVLAPTETPPAKVFWAPSCRTPPPVTVSVPAFWITAPMLRFGVNGAKARPSYSSGVTVIVRSAPWKSSRPLIVEIVAGL